MRAYMWDQMKDWLLLGAIETDEKMKDGGGSSRPGVWHQREESVALESKARCEEGCGQRHLGERLEGQRQSDGKDTLKLSADGKTLTDSNKEMKLDGNLIDSTTVYSRASGGPGLAGKWQTKKVPGGGGMIEMTASGSDGLTFKDLDQGMTCVSKLDGKDYLCTGPMLPPGFTSAVKTAGRSLHLTVRRTARPSSQPPTQSPRTARRSPRPAPPPPAETSSSSVFDRM